jgi:hypothetical protein
VDDGEAELALCQVFGEAFEGRVAGGGGEVEMVVEDLEEEADGGDEGGAVAEVWLACSRFSEARIVVAYTWTALSACMSLMASRNRPPVLLPTISR